MSVPVVLPPQPGGNIPLPAQPSNPPTFQDVREARHYCEMVQIAMRNGHGATLDDADRAELYKTTVMIAHATSQSAFGLGVVQVNTAAVAQTITQAVAQALPVTLASMLPNALADALSNALANELPNALAEALPDVLANVLPDVLADVLPDALADVLPDALTDAQPDFGEIEASLLRFEQSFARANNLRSGDGTSWPYTILPFHDGSIPDDSNESLPPLRTFADIQALNDVQVNGYLTGYGLTRVNSNVANKRAIAKFIGSQFRR